MMILPYLVVWTFNLILIGADVILSMMIARYRTPATVILGVLCLGVAGLILSWVLGREPFLIMRLVAYLIFAHIPVVLIIATALLWRSRRFVPIALALVAGSLAAVAVDAFLVEPKWLEVTHARITTTKLQRPIRIAILADVQTDDFGEYERSAFRRCLEARPDIILLAGDYLQVDSAPDWIRLQAEFNRFLKEIDFSAPLGIYAVQGNTDHPRWSEIFDGIPVHLLTRTDTVDAGPIQVTGLEVMDSFNRSLIVHGNTAASFHIVLGHAPDFALGDIRADLLVAGHTHGGQVRLPGIGPLLTATQVPKSWTMGITRLDASRTLIVSRGIGMERLNAPRLRFLCRPELVLVDVVPASITESSLAER